MPLLLELQGVGQEWEEPGSMGGVLHKDATGTTPNNTSRHQRMEQERHGAALQPRLEAWRTQEAEQPHWVGCAVDGTGATPGRQAAPQQAKKKQHGAGCCRTPATASHSFSAA